MSGILILQEFNGKRERKTWNAFQEGWRRDHTVPIETPQSMLEEPSSGSKTTQYLHNHKILN